MVSLSKTHDTSKHNKNFTKTNKYDARLPDPMYTQKLSKKGRVTKAKTGEMLIVNEKGTAYQVSEPVIAIWDSFNEKSISEVIDAVAASSRTEPEKVKEPVERVVSQLLAAELLGSNRS